MVGVQAEPPQPFEYGLHMTLRELKLAVQIWRNTVALKRSKSTHKDQSEIEKYFFNRYKYESA